MTARVNVRQYLNSDAALSVTAAGEVFTALINAMNHSDAVVVDFEGVRNATTVFLNTALGQIYRLHNPDYVDERMAFENTTPLVASMVRLTLNNAKLFYAESPHQDVDGDE